MFTCRNCDEKGHFTKECPKPRDYSRVKCSNCEQSTLRAAQTLNTSNIGAVGHGKARCPLPPKEEGADGGFGAADGGFGGDDGGFGATETNAGGDWNAGGDAGNNASAWSTEPAAAVSTTW